MDFRKFQRLYNSRERDFLRNGTPREWETHLRSLGMRRHEEPNKGFVVWSDVLNEWISFPEEIATKMMTLGFIP